MNPLGILAILENVWSKSPEEIYLNLIKSGILWIKSRDSYINIAFSFYFIIIFYYHIKRLFIISNFIKRDKVTVCNWYQSLYDKLMSEYVVFKIKILWILVLVKRLYLKRLKKTYRNKEKISRRDRSSSW